MKEEMESLEIRAVIKELQSLKGGFVKKVYQPNDDEILIKVYLPGQGTKQLLFKVGDALFMTDADKQNPKKPGDYVMLMRKFTSNARILNIDQHEFDRVVFIELQKEKKSRLIFEIFGKGNLILEGEKNILVPYQSESWSHRELKEGHEYRFPPSRIQPFKLSKEELKDLLEESEKDLVRALAVDLNLGGKYAEEICSRLNISKHSEEYEDLSTEIFLIIRKMKTRLIEGNLEPYTVKNSEGEVIDAIPFPLTQYEEFEKERYESYNQAVDIAFREGDSQKSEEKGKTRSKLDRKLESQRRALKNLKKEERENKIKAELIYQNYSRCQRLLDKIKEARAEGDRDKIYSRLREKDEIIQLNDSDEYIIVELEGEKDNKRYEMEVKLEFRNDVNENAQEHYEKSKKCKKKIEGAKEAIENTKQEIEAGKKKKEEKITKEPTKKYWFDKYKWFISSEENLVVAGKDTKTNEEVVKKYLEKYDRYAHAEAGGAPSVVVKKGKKDKIGEDTLKEACQYSVIHSKEWKRGVSAATAYWVTPDQVSKSPESGESLPTGAFVIRGSRNYVDDLKMKAVLIEIDHDGERKIMCAPSSTLNNRKDKTFKKIVEFIPGNKDPNDFSKEMSDYFSVPIKEIQGILPPGGVKVLNKKKVDE